MAQMETLGAVLGVQHTAALAVLCVDAALNIQHTAWRLLPGT
jgi:ribosomal 30S subunit maturation factor RimM